jgi:hypothetical protein
VRANATHATLIAFATINNSGTAPAYSAQTGLSVILKIRGSGYL